MPHKVYSATFAATSIIVCFVDIVSFALHGGDVPPEPGALFWLLNGPGWPAFVLLVQALPSPPADPDTTPYEYFAYFMLMVCSSLLWASALTLIVFIARRLAGTGDKAQA